MKTIITFDIDWAPDWAIGMCHMLCRRHGVPATFFATHQSDYLQQLIADPSVEVGIHPNYLPGSSHGESIPDIVSYCMELVPGAFSMRTHALHQSTPIFAQILDMAPSIQADVSLFLPHHPRLQPTLLHLGKVRPLVRLPYFWEDDIAACTPGWDWHAPPDTDGGLRIFDFHPVHVALNMARLESYYDLKSSLSRPLWAATELDFEPFLQRQSPGTFSFLEGVLAAIEPGTASTVRDVAGDYLARGWHASGSDRPNPVADRQRQGSGAQRP